MIKIKDGFKKISTKPGRFVRYGIFSLGFAGIAFTWTLQAENPKTAAWSQDERNQLPVSEGPDIYNAPAYRVMKDEIIRSILADKSLSPHARQVEILVVNGVVTLSGKVENFAEQERIVNYARESAGTARVENQMEIKQTK